MSRVLLLLLELLVVPFAACCCLDSSFVLYFAKIDSKLYLEVPGPLAADSSSLPPNLFVILFVSLDASQSASLSITLPLRFE